MKKKKLLAVGLGLSLVLTTACGKKEELIEGPIEKPVVVQELSLENLANNVEISGNIKPSEMIKLGFKVAGTIENINVKEGDKVGQGQLLMNLVKTDYETGLMGAQSKYDTVRLELESKIRSSEEQAKASLDFIDTQLGRVERLYEKGAIAKKDLEELQLQRSLAQTKYDEVLAAKLTAQAQLQQAQALVDGESLKLGYTNLTSPTSGTVIKKLFEPGEIVAPGYPTIVLGKLDKLEVEIGVPDTEVDKMVLASNVNVYIKGIDKDLSGTITNVGESADLETRTFPVKISIDNPKNEIRPGMIATVRIDLGQKNTIVVPVDAIVDNSQGKFLFVYDSKTKTVKKKPIKVGQVYENKLEILEGVVPGEIVVVDGQYRLNDGDLVRTRGEKND